jgi:uncharacterized protein YfaS (alpha-2-macroglobulin family)
VSQSGFDLAVPDKPMSQRLEVFREFVGADGKPLSQVKLGDEVEVHVKLRSLDKGELYNLALVDLLPGGFEVVIQPPTTSDSDDEENDKQDKEEDGSGSKHGDDGDSNEGGEGGEGEGGDEHSDEGGGGGGAKTPAEPAVLPFAKESSTFKPEYGDVREDRVVLYGSVGTELKEFVYAIKATNLGTFIVPPLQGEGMYDRTILSRSAGGRMTVVK